MGSCLPAIHTRGVGRQQIPAPEGQADSSRGQARSAPPPVREEDAKSPGRGGRKPCQLMD